MKYLLDRFVQLIWTNRPIRQRGTVIVAIPVIGMFASLIAISGLRESAIQLRNQANINQEILQETNRLLTAMVDAETGIRGYGLTKRPDFLEPYLEGKKSLPPLLAKLKLMVGKNQPQAQELAEIKKITEQHINFLQNTLKKLDSSATRVPSPEINQVLAQGKLKMDKIRDKIDAFADANKAYHKAQERQIRELRDLTNFLQVGGLLVGCLGAVACWYLFDSLEQELRKREAGLEESKTRIQAVVDNAADGIITLDERGKIESFNAAAEKIFGEKTDRIIGSNLRRLIAQPQPYSTAGDYSIEYFVLNPEAKLKTYQQETVGVRSDGIKFPMELAVSEMRLANQHLFIAICRDARGRKQAEETLRKQAQMLDLANDTIAVLDLNGEISYWNLGAKWLYGWPKSQAIGKNIHELLQTEWPQPFEEIQKVFFELGSWQGELLRTKEDGTKITVASRWTLQRDEQDQPLAILEISNDISDRKCSEIALAESAQRFRDTFEQAAVGMAQSSVDGKLLLVNQKLCEILGYSRQELIDKKFQEITLPEDLAKEVEFLRQLLAGEIENYCIEKRYVRKDGDLVWSNLTVSLLRKQNGTQFLMGVAEDIRERKQAEESLQLRAQELTWTANSLAKMSNVLRKRNQELDQFAYVVSHDLKAPLRAIANLSSWIEEDLSDAMTEDTLHQMNLLRGRVHRMEALIEGLLQYSRVGRIQVASETVKVENLLAEIIDSLAPPSGFEVKVEPGMPTFVTERLSLQQVFANLISNAIKHNRSESGYVKISVKELETFYEFAVADDGPGIAPQYHDKVFVIFRHWKLAIKLKILGLVCRW
ncbi:MAG: PAS domain S-box protein [Microcoleus sp.]